MTIDPANLSGSPLVERVKNILQRPQEEWTRIEAEEAEVGALYRGYVAPLAALSAICATIGFILFPSGVLSVHLNPVQALISGAFQFALALICIFVMGVIINALAPNFGSQQDVVQAHKVAAYGSTAGLLVGVFSLHPWLGIFALLGFYSLALIWFGLPKLMKTPEDKKPMYFLSVIGLTLVAGLVISLIAGSINGALQSATSGMPAFRLSQQSRAGDVALPGGGTVNLTELEREAQAFVVSDGLAIDPARLQEQLPQTLPGGFQLANASSASAMGTAQAEGEYRSGEARINVTIMHMAGAGALAALTAATGVEETHRTEDGYARMQSIDGRLYTEEVNTTDSAATYAVVGNGVALTAAGTGVTVDQVRAAVETIGIQRLERQFGT